MVGHVTWIDLEGFGWQEEYHKSFTKGLSTLRMVTHGCTMPRCAVRSSSLLQGAGQAHNLQAPEARRDVFLGCYVG